MIIKESCDNCHWKNDEGTLKCNGASTTCSTYFPDNELFKKLGTKKAKELIISGEVEYD